MDDDSGVRELLADCLGMLGHRVAGAGDRRDLDALVASGSPPDLFLLDVALPGTDGLTLAREIRAGLDPGIIMLTGAGDLVDRVAGLEVGADDYLAKPFEPAELAARIDAVLRRRRAGDDAIAFGPYRLDLRAFELRDAAGVRVELSPMEIDLVAAFATNPRSVLSRDVLLRLAPPRDGESLDRSIDHGVTRLRRKLEADPEHPTLIKTVRGGGYVYTPRVPAPRAPR